MRGVAFDDQAEKLCKIVVENSAVRTVDFRVRKSDPSWNRGFTTDLQLFLARNTVIEKWHVG